MEIPQKTKTRTTTVAAVQSLSRVQLFATLWTEACQALHHLPELAQIHVS